MPAVIVVDAEEIQIDIVISVIAMIYYQISYFLCIFQGNSADLISEGISKNQSWPWPNIHILVSRVNR